MEPGLEVRWLSQQRNPVHQFQEKTIPQPHEDFEPYFAQYTEYDSVLGESLSTVHELSIAGGPYSGGGAPGAYPSSPPSFNSDELTNVTVKPASLARYSKMMNYNNVAPTPASMTDTTFLRSMTPVLSPMKHPGATEVYLQDSSPVSLTTPPALTYSSTAGHITSSPFYPRDEGYMAQMPNSSPSRRRQSVFAESDSDGYLSSSEQSPNLDGSPEIQSASQFLSTGVTPGMASINVFSSIDMVPVDTANSSIAWQPILTAPQNETSEEIIRRQQAAGKQSNRKSCLPPGKVDSYMAGPNGEGLFECLFPNCGKLFRRRYNVRSHIQTHLCDRPYSCDTCNATFVRPHDLRRHEKCHQEERPYSCPCGKGFTRHDALQRHRLRMICSGGIEIPGKPRKAPGKRGRPKKVRSMANLRANAEEESLESDSEDQLDFEHSSPLSDNEIDYFKDEMNYVKEEQILWSR